MEEAINESPSSIEDFVEGEFESENLDNEYLISKSPKEASEVQGSVAFIYHRDKETGAVEYLFEQKPDDYIPTAQRGKFSLIGGTRESGEESLETLIRELEEEFESKAAKSILIRILRNNPVFYVTKTDVDGKRIAVTDIYEIEVESKKDWEIIKMSKSSDDAGNFMVFSSKTALELDKEYYAFDYGWLIKGFIIENENKNPSYSMHNTTENKMNLFKPTIYPDSIMVNNSLSNLYLLSRVSSTSINPSLKLITDSFFHSSILQN